MCTKIVVANFYYANFYQLLQLLTRFFYLYFCYLNYFYHLLPIFTTFCCLPPTFMLLLRTFYHLSITSIDVFTNFTSFSPFFTALCQLLQTSYIAFMLLKLPLKIFVYEIYYYFYNARN